ncbi:peptide-N4-(N-acetyl-beta-glucosaminyl)asparagine amidase A-like [Manihot esculenta]|uniref:Uncharacterized protein n=1 Tax=Manihot esculenta TaxID=3983 RepID=A0ACB7HFN7_MANES|nr:peptide-N4-(N-acetyl-beta-glucosaminyl)asparagine amidase A-like [Manihot esculenta]KAG8651493.1 hypothetical protein MANES_07G134200v8 [Manihot esculenta]
MKTVLILLCLLLFTLLTLVSPSAALNLQEFQEFFEVTPPLPSDHWTPSCTHPIIQHSFTNNTNTTNYLFSTPYSPPSDCSSPWTYIVLSFNAGCSNDTSYRISGLWLGGVELLRTITPKLTTDKSRNSWTVKKDITRYSSLLAKEDLNLTMILQSIVDNVSTGVYNVSVTVLFYKNSSITVSLNRNDLSLPILAEKEANGDGDSVLEGVLSFYDTPADLIIPISDDGDTGFWYRIKNEIDLPSKQILVPCNTHRAVLELYVSFHGNDESWYSNPPSSYLRMNNISLQGNGAYREVFVTIDGASVGSELPFPVVLTSEFNSLFWKPVVSIGAFNLPSYDFEVTPFLEKVLDGQVHEFGVGIGNVIPYWLVDANLHIWLDKGSSSVTAGTVVAHNPSLALKSRKEFKRLDGSFEVKGKGGSESKGWVISTAGNLTTLILQEFRFQSFIQFQKNATKKFVKLKIKVNKEIQVLNDRGELLKRVIVKRKYPLNMITTTIPGRIVANVSHAFLETWSNGNNMSRTIDNLQKTNGWMPIVEQQASFPGESNTNQRLIYRDISICYSRTIAVTHGILSADDLSYGCISSS